MLLPRRVSSLLLLGLLSLTTDAVTSSFAVPSSSRTTAAAASIVGGRPTWQRIRGGGGGSGRSGNGSINILKSSTTFLSASASNNGNNNKKPSQQLTSPSPSPQSSSTSLQQSSSSSVETPPPSQPQSSPLLDDAGRASISELFDELGSSPFGLDGAAASSLLEKYGPNELRQPPATPLWKLVLEQFEDRLVQILLIVAVMSASFSVYEVMQEGGSGAGGVSEESLLQSFVEPLVILAILVVNATIGVVQARSASDSLRALQKLQPQYCLVVRDKVVEEMSASQLVPGDVIQIRVGDKVPADCRLVSTTTTTGVVQVDEASLTGESVTVSKLPGDEGRALSPNMPIQNQRGMMYAGTVVTRGSGTALVVKTGMATQIGKIQEGVSAAKQDVEKTPLARRLDQFGETLTVVIGVICFAVWLVSIPKMNDPSFHSVWDGAIYYAKVAVALGVAAIPEGLPAVITLCLSLGTRRMAERNVIVRKLQSVETLGCTSVICTDKTGTLTTNEMTVVSLVLFEHDGKTATAATATAPPAIADIDFTKTSIREHAVEGVSYSPIGKVDGIAYNKEVHDHPLGSLSDVAAVSALCNDAKIVGSSGDEDDEEEEEVVDETGNVTMTTTASGVVADNTTSSTIARVSTAAGGRTSKANNKKGSGDATKKTYERIGEPTEAALCVLTEKLGGMSHFLDVDSATVHDHHGLHLNVPPSVLACANVNAWRDAYKRIVTLEFDRDRKSMSVLCNFPGATYPSADEYHAGVQPRRKAGAAADGCNNRLLVKGAPNLLIERCTHIKFRDGTVSKLTGELRRSIETKVSEMAARPLRCLALAVKDNDALDDSLRSFQPQTDRDVTHHPLLSNPDNYRNIESGLCLVGVVGIKDPARPEVADSITECSEAGIRVIMITGDAKDTAIAIARDVRIFPSDETEPVKAFEGREFFNKPPREQLRILAEGKDNIVFCRAEPADKQQLVKMLQGLGEIPAMTGDGVNDAPALQQAAIGVAMGITGTEVSKEASDMILADDNFSTIVNAVEEGRRIYANMQAFICFLISCNIGEICAIFFATLAGFPEPLTAMHLLWVNLVTDGPPATALGFNPASPDLMEQPPRPSDEPILTRWLLTRYCVTGLYVGLATIGVFVQHYMQLGISIDQLMTWSQCGEFWSPPLAGGAEGVGTAVISCSELFQGSGRMLPQTMSLTTLICMEMIKALSAVSIDNSIIRVGPQNNPWLILGVSVPMLLHLFVLYSSKLGLPGLGESFGMVPLSSDQWITVLCWAAPVLLVEEIMKAIGRWIYNEERIKRRQELKPAKEQ